MTPKLFFCLSEARDSGRPMIGFHVFCRPLRGLIHLKIGICASCCAPSPPTPLPEQMGEGGRKNYRKFMEQNPF
jgi:hypothetical protein